jgi:hypothetical protein
MNHPAQNRRRLIMHPAHRSVGVSGEGIGSQPYCWLDDLSADAPDLPFPHKKTRPDPDPQDRDLDESSSGE